MKPARKRNRTSSPKTSNKSFIGVVVAASILVIGVVTALSMQGKQPQKPQVVEDNPQPVEKQSNRNYVTLDEAGLTVAVDRQTGKVRPLTPEEAKRLADGIKQMVNQSTDGLVEVHHEDGSVSMNLQGRFQNVMLAKKEDDGTITQSCVDNLEAAAAFFEIDPALLGLKAPVSKAPISLKPEIR